MNMIEDDAWSAFQAAYQGDWESAGSHVTRILGRPAADVCCAAAFWMDRCIDTADLALDDQVKIRIQMISDHSGTGMPETIADLPRDIYWAGSLFAAYCRKDKDAGQRMWETIPDDQMHLYLLRLLTTMACTVRAYHEDGAGDLTDAGTFCCRFCREFYTQLHADPAAVNAAVAKAHLN